MQIAPIDVVEVIRAFGGFIAVVCIPLATVYIMIMTHRQKKIIAGNAALNEKIDGMLKDRDAANVSKGERRGEEHGRDRAEALAEGQRQGRETAMSMIPTRSIGSGNDDPVPVEDEAAAKISKDIAKSTAESAEATNAINKRVAEATEKSAEAQQQIADAATKPK